MDFTSIHNYYEHLVIDYIQTRVIPEIENKDEDFLLDVACYALTKLPARYMRHEIDMAFYLDSREREKISTEVARAVKDALKHIEQNNHKDDHD
ncbi:MAG: late competence development ComFB family protein [Gammaproteobacteria bacterium]|nr:late competence development ComFB family protein [Gammaproteobacteria bacterium]MCW8911341.1 late competence development ComFB family protein [Gammaproteobacteria bacterium]MCW9005357.1 late competence development ComFB family protein [Gammaproteobacteria bacterium]MCW9057094.1 late competence development ComFB family protein [Gammaproteobacteria bacterium]